MGDILHIIADELKEFTSKPPILNRAIVKLAIQDLYGDKQWNVLNYKEWKGVIEKGIGNRLALSKIGNIDHIIKKLLLVLAKNQSLIAMSNF